MSFDALSFYLDNQEEINTYIERTRIPEELIHPAVKAAIINKITKSIIIVRYY